MPAFPSASAPRKGLTPFRAAMLAFALLLLLGLCLLVLGLLFSTPPTIAPFHFLPQGPALASALPAWTL